MTKQIIYKILQKFHEVGGSNLYIYMFIPTYLGKTDSHFDQHIFQMGGSTTNQFTIYIHWKCGNLLKLTKTTCDHDTMFCHHVV